ncbi:RrF2 family transcriptional regulator [Methylobrevis pamukkalensis]|uniref:HTH-type transcriptional regulator CymR n=1 Tax=Methylobrevis pamukkalensis TaxID=1439726 RepID=A0A1E3H7R2_9HYPH|nr:Rrf2 family transcriptional regulator [Methylobrevis pamukkalensis]ODN72378.1 HTH-type transcriptional regulator CymR [Methylobrevis pamukkalensis]
MITQKAKYAFKALLYLCKADGREPAQVEDIAGRTGIPRKFLEHILLNLKHSGLIASRRGRNGGYILIKDPAEVSLGQVLRMIDGPIAPLPCLSKTAYRPCPDCADEPACAIRKVFGDIYAATLLSMEGVTLADLVRSDRLLDLDGPGLEALAAKA